MAANALHPRFFHPPSESHIGLSAARRLLLSIINLPSPRTRLASGIDDVCRVTRETYTPCLQFCEHEKSTIVNTASITDANANDEMATPQSTGSQDDVGEGKKLEQITFRFCSECSNMLYPKEDEDAHKLQFTCRTCQYTEEAASTCVFRNVLNNSAGETAGVTQDVGSDPTVSPAPSLCLLCNNAIECAFCDTPAEIVACFEIKPAKTTDSILDQPLFGKIKEEDFDSFQKVARAMDNSSDDCDSLTAWDGSDIEKATIKATQTILRNIEELEAERKPQVDFKLLHEIFYDEMVMDV